LTTTGHGVVGIATAQTKCGVLGSNDGGVGVGGRSEVGVGVLGGSVHHNGVAGLSVAPLDITRIFDDPVFAGVAGVSTVGVGVLAQSMAGTNAVGLYATAPQAAAVFKGTVVVEGNLVIKAGYNLIIQTPGAKNGVVSFADGSDRLVCAIESPEAWFEDFGEASLVKGKARVVLDPSFMRTIEVNRFHVFITPYGETAGLYVSRRSKRGFDVTERKPGKSSVRFSWRVAARPRSATNKRFAKTSLVKSVNRLGSATGRTSGRRSFDVTALNTTGLAVPLHKEPKLPKRAKPKSPEPPKLLKPAKLPELPKDRKPNAKTRQAMEKARKPRGG
jgi:hypothetical protein